MIKGSLLSSFANYKLWPAAGSSRDNAGIAGHSTIVFMLFYNYREVKRSNKKLNKTNHGGIQAQTNMTEATVNGKQNMKRFAIFEHVSRFRKRWTVSIARMHHLLGT